MSANDFFIDKDDELEYPDRIVNLFRYERSDQGTIGFMTSSNFSCYTIELPWNDNQRQISCIPPGIYPTVIRISPKYGRTYWVQNVTGRSYILIHSGNWGGYKLENGENIYRTHTMGCILPGSKPGFLAGQRAVLNSRITLRKFMDRMKSQPFTLRVWESFDI